LKARSKAFEPVIGQSKLLHDAKKFAAQAADTDASILITGETGTGKELFAEAIHQISSRSDGPLIKVNCAAIQHDLIESELFGYEAGAFTGARSKGKPGKFELADGGTIFLDEIGDMPRAMQAKLLRVIQGQEFERVGGNRIIRSDFRVIAATNKDIKKLIENETFRSDLFYRLNTFQIVTPKLRDMVEDIQMIAYHFLSRSGKKRGSGPNRISDEAMIYLKQYPWPGNVRELKNVMERTVNITNNKVVTVDDLPIRIKEFNWGKNSHGNRNGLLQSILKEAEKQAIVSAIQRADGNKAKASTALGIHRSSLYQKIKQYRLSV